MTTTPLSLPCDLFRGPGCALGESEPHTRTADSPPLLRRRDRNPSITLGMWLHDHRIRITSTCVENTAWRRPPQWLRPDRLHVYGGHAACARERRATSDHLYMREEHSGRT